MGVKLSLPAKLEPCLHELLDLQQALFFTQCSTDQRCVVLDCSAVCHDAVLCKNVCEDVLTLSATLCFAECTAPLPC